MDQAKSRTLLAAGHKLEPLAPGREKGGASREDKVPVEQLRGPASFPFGRAPVSGSRPATPQLPEGRDPSALLT
ncbi:hypothetical protein ACCO45_008541 [Purpureocillium lilacinum]|uniref:Uncharacterized protein n=1 Tax=Purpureocillium lilacinum TaxID=33203 RepID=A0ACC4DPM4_PURLI